ncbi:RagB/SusD family nutrient uptake outer membrane protein [Chitinophaga japonensis]|uniref:Putative outer membrane starch-binding protein n=1 Tax=Chitinophaga japonensis TaxID=104662 RepID=A0A562T311_CHIJA|nr:RagB/SusD family nutrient uptake outer membrane protein [Chitinophaga japonensis]TWI87989.1 putative outer membrane starch-binding protein [Chitinophaga japonensis]
MAGLVLGGCNGFLDEKPQSELTPDQFWQNEDDIKTALAGVYDGVQGCFDANFIHWGDARTDNLDVTQYGNKQYAQNGLSATTEGTDWSQFYVTILRANTLMQYAPGIKNVPAADLDQYMGQCLAIRAYCYFWIARIWGDAPVWLEAYSSLAESPYRARTSVDSIFTGIIIPDLQKAFEMMNTDHSSVYNVNKGAVAAMLTEVYMWRKDYGNALTWSDKLTALNWYSLASRDDWKKLFTDPTNTPENIWSLHWDFLVDGGADISGQIGANNTNGRFSVEDTLWNYFVATPDDIRGPMSVDMTVDNRDKMHKYYAIKKDKDGHQIFPKNSEANILFPLYRLADILLLRAEALNKTGDKSGALALLNQVHTRAGLPPLEDADFANADSLENGILQERQIELFLEGRRWFDLVRTGKVISTMDPVLKRRVPDGPGFGDPRLVLFPIHRNNLNSNPLLKQNPPYSE